MLKQDGCCAIMVCSGALSGPCIFLLAFSGKDIYTLMALKSGKQRDDLSDAISRELKRVSCNMKIVSTSAHNFRSNCNILAFSSEELLHFHYSTPMSKTQFCFPQTIREATDIENRQVNCVLLYFFQEQLWYYSRFDCI